MTTHRKRWRFGFLRAFGALSSVLAAATLMTAAASAASAAAPQSSATPTFSGQSFYPLRDAGAAVKMGWVARDAVVFLVN
jgi:hypothetical protein